METLRPLFKKRSFYKLRSIQLQPLQLWENVHLLLVHQPCEFSGPDVYNVNIATRQTGKTAERATEFFRREIDLIPAEGSWEPADVTNHTMIRLFLQPVAWE